MFDTLQKPNIIKACSMKLPFEEFRATVSTRVATFTSEASKAFSSLDSVNVIASAAMATELPKTPRFALDCIDAVYWSVVLLNLASSFSGGHTGFFAAAMLLPILIKEGLRINRPYTVIDFLTPQMKRVFWSGDRFSLPSGHAFMVGAYFWLYPFWMNGVLALSLISRVIGGVHYLWDMGFGLSLGMLFSWCDPNNATSWFIAFVSALVYFRHIHKSTNTETNADFEDDEGTPLRVSSYFNRNVARPVSPDYKTTTYEHDQSPYVYPPISPPYNFPDTKYIPTTPPFNPPRPQIDTEGDRPTWDEWFAGFAEMASLRSTCGRLHVGCVLVKDNRVISMGYNGQLSGCSHDARVVDGHEMGTVHAEQNAIAYCASSMASCDGATAYITHFPCIHCFKLLAAAKVQTIKYMADYQNDDLVGELAVEKGVQLIPIFPTEEEEED